MKSSHFFALLKNDVLWVLPALFFGIYILFQNVTRNSVDHMFFLSYGSNGSDVFLLLIPFMSINPLFLNGSYGVKTPNVPQLGTLEFFFSRAINRTTLFCAKTSIYLGMILLPLTTVWAYSYVKPLVRIELPYNTPADREATKQFYLDHFKDAYVQKDEQDKEGNKYYVVLPEGQVDIAAFTFLISFTGTLIFQIVALAFLPTRFWKIMLTYLAIIIIPSVLANSGGHYPSFYERGLGWVAQHTLLSFSALLIFTMMIQLYCCRRFVQTEIST